MNRAKVMTMMLALAMGAGIVALADPALASLKCQRELAKNTQKYALARAKFLSKCEEDNLKKGLSNDCYALAATPDGKVDKAKTKTIDKITTKCAGTEKDTSFGLGRCPVSEGVNADPLGPVDCSNLPGLVATEQDIADCLVCVAEEHTDEFNELLYGNNPPAAGDATDCRIAVGKETNKYLKARYKAMQKCEDGRLKGKITEACPDSAKSAPKIIKAERKKIAKICAACNSSGVCPTIAPPVLRCTGGVNFNLFCTTDADCPGGYACDPEIEQKCQLTSAASQLGQPCELDGDCHQCLRGTSTAIGDSCTTPGGVPGVASPACRQCVGGGNEGAPCTTASQCPGGACPLGSCLGGANSAAFCSNNSECPGSSCATRCGDGRCFSDGDLQIADIGVVANCPPIVANNSTTGAIQGVKELIECVDRHSGERTDCLDALGSSTQFPQGLPSQCSQPEESCDTDFNQVTVTVALNFVPADVAACVGGVDDGLPCEDVGGDTDCTAPGDCQDGLGGVAISLGYEDVVTIPGTGDVGTRDASLQGGSIVSNDTNEQTLTLLATFGSTFAPGNIYTMLYDTCGGAVSTSNFACQVRNAVNAAGAPLLGGVSCSVVSVL